MKKSFILFAASLLALVGCTRNQEIDIQENGLSLFARTESPADTKTVVESGTHVYWEPGDEIAVFMGEKSAKFTTDITAASGTATFKGTFGEETWPEDLDLWAVYPFSEEATFDGETIITTLPSEQIAREGSFGKDMNLSIAHSNSSTLQFYNVGGGIRFSVTEEGIKKVMFEGLGEETLAGQIKISFQNGVPSYSEGAVKIPHIALLAPGDGFVPGEWYYMNALPQSLSKGFQLRFFKDGSSGVRVFEKSVEIKRSIFGSIENVDAGVEYYNDEMVQVDDDAIEDIINQCIDTGIDVETVREELESFPSVASVEINEMETTVRFASGQVIFYPYNFPSIFDQDDTPGAAISSNRNKQINEMAPTRASEYVDAAVAIFNLFSEDSGRTNQNKLVEKTKGIFERNGLSVHIYGRDDFTINNLITAIEKNVLIYISSLGTSSGKVVLGQRRMTGDSVSWDYRGFVDETDFAKYDKANRYVINIPAALRDLHYSGPLVYLASCYTPENNNSNLHLVGWNGVNRVGQAYGLIFADYMIHWGKSFKAFSIDFSEDHSPYGTIYDPIEYDPKKEKNTKLIHYGNGWGADVFDDSGWTQQKNDNKVVIDQPTPGTCNKKLKYTVKLSYRNDGSIVTDGKTVTYENGNKYYFDYSDLGDEMTGIGWRSDPLRFKDNVVEYKVNGLTAGVWRFLSFNTVDNVHYGDVNARDCTYAIFSHSFKENDVQEDDTPSVVTLETMAGTNDLVLGGAVINRSLAGLETGFQYWKKDAPTNKSTIATSTTYEDYFGAVLQIPDLNGEYEYRAFAKDEEGLIGYGDVLSFKAGDTSQQEFAIPEIVDLGLSVKWASFNLGASKPEEFGDYYAWGEIEPYYSNPDPLTWKPGKESGYWWPSYKWSLGDHKTMTKYCNDASYGFNGFTDTKIVLDPEDDAAHVKLGGKWRMPTDAEWTELMDNCIWMWITRNGITGRLVTSSNGKSIFLPAAGNRAVTDLYLYSSGVYWSSSLCTDSPNYAWFFGFNEFDVQRGNDLSRCLGLSIRPVCE